MRKHTGLHTSEIMCGRETAGREIPAGVEETRVAVDETSAPSQQEGLQSCPHGMHRTPAVSLHPQLLPLRVCNE